MRTRQVRARAQWAWVLAALWSGLLGLGAALAVERWAGDRLPPRRRLAAALLWGLCWTAATRLWWWSRFYEAAAWFWGLATWPRAGAAALVAGWVFWALLLSAGLPGFRAWSGRAAPQTPGRLAPPPATVPPGPPTPPADGTALGVAAGGRVAVWSDQQASTHLLATGATGAGKTNALKLLIRSAAARGLPLIVIDGKGSAELRARVEGIGRQARREVRAFRFDGAGVHWNPLRHGDPTQRRDLIGAALTWGHEYYQAVAERWLHAATTALEAAGVETSLRAITRLMNANGEALGEVIRNVPDAELAQRLLAIVDGPDQGARSAVAGAAHRLGRLTDSRIGPYLEPAPDGEAEIDLLESAITPGGPIALFSLDTLAYPETARALAAMILQNLQYVASALMARGNERPVYLIIDEFAAFEVQQLLALLNRGREAGLRCVLATQDLADLERSGGRVAVDQVLANTGTKLCLRVDIRDTAQRLAATAGTVPAWRATHRTAGGTLTGEGTAQADEAPVLQPGALMRLGPGEAVLIEKHPEVQVRHLRVYRAT